VGCGGGAVAPSLGLGTQGACFRCGVVIVLAAGVLVLAAGVLVLAARGACFSSGGCLF
jgi:hypothetical protein